LFLLDKFFLDARLNFGTKSLKTKECNFECRMARWNGVDDMELLCDIYETKHLIGIEFGQFG